MTLYVLVEPETSEVYTDFSLENVKDYATSEYYTGVIFGVSVPGEPSPDEETDPSNKYNGVSLIHCEWVNNPLPENPDR